MPSAVVLLEFYRIAEQARALYLRGDWQLVRKILDERNRTEEHAQALRAVALVATAMAQSLEENVQGPPPSEASGTPSRERDVFSLRRPFDRGDGQDEGPTNYGIQRYY